jgi:hypothetical protein
MFGQLDLEVISTFYIWEINFSHYVKKYIVLLENAQGVLGITLNLNYLNMIWKG